MIQSRYPLLLTFAPRAQAIVHLRFQDWYPAYSRFFQNASAYCQPQITDYLDDVATSPTFGAGTPAALAADCVMQDMGPTMAANLTAAQVLLGLLPTITLFFAPSIAKVAVLSTCKPLLAVLLALSCPGIYVEGLFAQVDVVKCLGPSTSVTAVKFDRLQSKLGARGRVCKEILCYVAVLAALANNVHNAVYLDIRTIPGWSPGALFVPLAWSCLAVLVHLVGMLAIRKRSYTTDRRAAVELLHSNHWRSLASSKDSVLSECLFWFTNLLAIVFLIVGVFILSSLVFISALEALIVAIRFIISIVACHFVLLVQLAEIRSAPNVERGWEMNTLGGGHTESGHLITTVATNEAK